VSAAGIIIVAFHVYLFVQNARGVCGVYADYFPALLIILFFGAARTGRRRRRLTRVLFNTFFKLPAEIERQQKASRRTCRRPTGPHTFLFGCPLEYSSVRPDNKGASGLFFALLPAG